jgi:hypothetical protein
MTRHPAFQKPFSQALNNVDHSGESRGWTTAQGEYGAVKPIMEKSSAGVTTKRLVCDPNHPHWHTKPDPSKAYVGLASTYMDLGQQYPPGSMKQPMFTVHDKRALYWPEWFGVKDQTIADLERKTNKNKH